MQSLVNDGLEEGLNKRNSTILMMLGVEGNISTPPEQVYGYFTSYFSEGYGGYYAQGDPSEYILNFPWKMMLGLVNLKTGKLEIFGSSIEVSVKDIFYYADLANQ